MEPGVIDCGLYEGGRRVRTLASVDEIDEALKADDAFVWIGLHEPSEALLRRIQHEFGLHDLAIEDALRAHQRPKLETYEDSVFIVLHTVRHDPAARTLEFGETHLF